MYIVLNGVFSIEGSKYPRKVLYYQPNLRKGYVLLMRATLTPLPSVF